MNRLANVHSRPAPDVSSFGRSALIALFLVIAGIWVAAYLASYLFLWSVHLDPRGSTPLTIVRYAVYYGHYPFIHQHVLWSSGVSVLLVALLPAVLAIPKPRSLHGDARFARRAEIARAGLLGYEGLILGKLGSRLLMLPGQQSVILAAPPRSGKDVGVCIPNGLNWPGSLVVTDIKRENWTLTAGYRQSRGQACFRFEPLEPTGDTARWNPLSYVSPLPGQRINDIQRIADILYVEVPGTDPFWVASAKSLFVGIALYIFETPSAPKTIGELRRQGMATDDEGFGEHWRRIVQGRQKGNLPLSAECVRALYDVIDLAPVTASSVRKTFTSRLDLWANPLLDAATSGDDFDLRDLRKKPISIYVCVNPDDLHRLRSILSLFFQQLLGLQTQELPEHNPALVHQVLLLLNEFTALGRIPIVSEAMPYMPGYDVRILLVIQAPSQLREVYGQHNAETMMKSVAARIVFAPKDYSDAKDVSDELGFTTVRARSESRPNFLTFNHRQASREASTTFSQQQRSLLLPQEVKEIGVDRALIFYENLRPVKCKKIRYYADRRFRARLLPPPKTATPSGQIRPITQPPPAGKARPSKASPPSSDPAGTHSEAPAAAESGIRAAVLEDIEQLDSLTLEDFGEGLKNLRFEHAGERPTDAEMAADVDQFLEAIR